MSQDFESTTPALRLMLKESDRGFILLAQELIAKHLKPLLLKAMVADPHVKKEAITPLFSLSTSPLFSFWAQVRMSYALGLIGRSDFEILESLRSLRNPCAHYHVPISILPPKDKKGDYRCSTKFFQQAQIEWTLTRLSVTDGGDDPFAGKTSSEIDDIISSVESMTITIEGETFETTGPRAVFLVKLFAMVNHLRESYRQLVSPKLPNGPDWQQSYRQ